MENSEAKVAEGETKAELTEAEKRHAEECARAAMRAAADQKCAAAIEAEEKAKADAFAKAEAVRKAAVDDLTPRYQNLYEACQSIEAAKGMVKNAVIARRCLTKVEHVEIGKALAKAQELAGKAWNGMKAAE